MDTAIMIFNDLCYCFWLIMIFQLGRVYERMDAEQRRKAKKNGHNKHNSRHIIIRIQRGDVSSDMEELHKGITGAEKHDD